MSFFSSILSKLGLGSAEAATPSAASPEVSSTVSHASSSTSAMGAAFDRPAVVAEPVAAPVEKVDVVAHLTALAEKNPEQLNWKTSIVDLLKLLGLDSSLGARKELAQELGCPAEKMGDSAQMNMWLHKTVLQKIAENGGEVPAELLD